MKARSWLFLGFALLVAAACIRLGIWQLSRLEERRQRNARIRAGLESPTIALSALEEEKDPSLYRRVTVSGQYDAEREIVLTPRSSNGQAGVHLVTPLLLAGREHAVLVDRGWIPFADRELPARRKYIREGTITLEGITKPAVETPTGLFFGEKAKPNAAQPILEWRTVDIPAIQAQMPYPLSQVYVAATEASMGGRPAPVPQPDIDLSQGPHLGYALQWFSFAAIALVGGGYWLWRKTQETS